MTTTTSTHTLVIAEAGVNHNGSIDMACALIDSAAAAGADAVKFQTFRANDLVSARAPKADYQKRTTDEAESQLEMVRRLQLSDDDHTRLISHARNKNITFLSTPFDSWSLRLLAVKYGLDTIKISSGDITNAPFLLEIARTGKRVILSTGMSSLAEVEAALGVFAFGYTAQPQTKPDKYAFSRAFASVNGQMRVREQVSLLHCTSEYPAPCHDVNLRAMDTLQQAFGLAVGLSDHTRGIHIPIAAVARGARIIEKHFTLDRKLPGPDHAASVEPAELGAMVSAIRDVEAALGDGVKRPMPSEERNRDIARKSLVAARDVKAGHTLDHADLALKRPASGISPFEYWDYVGRRATRDYAADEAIEP